MEKLYSAGAMQMVPTGNGFAFIAKQNKIEDKILVAYQLYDMTTRRVSQISRSVYLLAKFGPHAKFFEDALSDYVNCHVALLPGNGVFIAYPSGECLIYDQDCQITWSGTLTFDGYGPAAVALDGDFVWISFPECNTVVQYRLSSMRAQLRIGAGGSDLFPNPGGLLVEDGWLYVCSQSDARVTRVNLATYETEPYGFYEEPVLQMMHLDRREIVLTETGIYSDL